MATKVFGKIANLPIGAHAAAAVASVVAFQLVKTKLDTSYAASQHPVDYMTGQTSFSGPTIKGYYAHMQDAGTLDVYVATQLIDFGFILAMACIGLFVCTLIARIGLRGSIGYRAGCIAGLLFVSGAVCDAIENGWSFVMLANPTGFADWLALPYSGFAVLKFALITLGLFGALFSLGAGLGGRVLAAFKRA